MSGKLCQDRFPGMDYALPPWLRRPPFASLRITVLDERVFRWDGTEFVQA